MSELKAITELAIELNADERAILGHRLFKSLHEPLDPAIEASWADEIERRVEEFERGEVEVIAFEEVVAEIRKQFTPEST